MRDSVVVSYNAEDISLNEMTSDQKDTLASNVKASFASSLGIDESLVEVCFIQGSIIIITLLAE